MLLWAALSLELVFRDIQEERRLYLNNEKIRLVLCCPPQIQKQFSLQDGEKTSLYKWYCSGLSQTHWSPDYRFTTAAKQFSLQINNIKKAKCLYQLPKLLNDVSLPTIVFINKKLLVESKAFLYPDRTVDDYARLDKEIFLRIEHASLVKEKFIKQSLE